MPEEVIKDMQFLPLEQVELLINFFFSLKTHTLKEERCLAELIFQKQKHMELWT